MSDREGAALVAHERAQWTSIREAAHEAFDAGRAYPYHDGAVTHRCTDMTELARVTRAERKRLAIRWREDG